MAELDFNLSPTVYVKNNPIGYIDLFGMTPKEVVERDGGTLKEVTITAKRPRHAGYFDRVFDNYKYGLDHHIENKASWTQKEIRNGVIGVGVAGAAVYGVAYGGAAVVSAIYSQGASYLTRANMISAGRWALRGIKNNDWKKTAYINAFANLGGKSIENSLKGELKLDVAGLGADIFGTTFGSALVGGIGEAGFDFDTKKFYLEPNTVKSGLGKFGTGMAFGKVGDNIFGVFDGFGDSAFSSVKVIYSEISKLMEESTNKKIDDKYGK